MNLILPVAGSSSRFPGLKPKWLLTHPSGNIMLIEAIRGLNLKEIDNIYLVCIREHYNKYELFNFLSEQFEVLGCANKLKIIILDNKTKSQPETVYMGIKKAKISGQIYIKDSDNFFRETKINGNFISTYDLNYMDYVNANNKSYISINEQNIVTNIVEKKIISPIFNVGGYGFENAETFCEYYEKLQYSNDLYISHIIYKMMLDGYIFENSIVNEYVDWGTIKDWNNYKSQFATLFVDIDGTLLENSGQFFSPRWGETKKIKENVDAINKLYDSHKVNIILTTSRTIDYKNITEEQLKKEGVKYHQIIFGLYHSKRIIINDYALSNPYKSCDSINLKRDSTELANMLEDIFKI
ncbi:hypothetical protein I12421_09300 [Campylobacter lari]|uniref:hypothetical protein n=1 Tax=Campylobacter lari TaxID=201 RepID=UPI002581564F|nr:hypothetical protein [Campylobacter lari]GMM10553.1 hypothetical protein I12421_09300 [Campylobacter lari]HDV6339770.1 hypothetical protein [Campylobacter lari]